MASDDKPYNSERVGIGLVIEHVCVKCVS